MVRSPKATLSYLILRKLTRPIRLYCALKKADRRIEWIIENSDEVARHSTVGGATPGLRRGR